MIGHNTIKIDFALIMTKIIVMKISTFEILTMTIVVVVQARLTLNDYEWLAMTTNDYEKWNHWQSWPESPICERV